jgi:hypothetical protein
MEVNKHHSSQAFCTWFLWCVELGLSWNPHIFSFAYCCFHFLWSFIWILNQAHLFNVRSEWVYWFWNIIFVCCKIYDKFPKQRQIAHTNMCMKVEKLNNLAWKSLDWSWMKKTKTNFIHESRIIKNENN